MKKLLFVVLILFSITLKAPPVLKYHKDLRSHIYYLEQKELVRKQNFDNFLLHLRMRESLNQWKIINQFGYMGLYQFGSSTLRTIGIKNITAENFKINPDIFPPQLQEIAVRRLLRFNNKILYQFIVNNEGYVINNIKITKSGLLAAAHLGGAGNVIKFLCSNGTKDFKDGFNTKISSYIEEFSNYNF